MNILINLFQRITNISWAAMTVSAMIGYGVLTLFLRKNEQKQKILDIVATAGVVMIVVWRLSVLLFHPELLTGSVSSLLTVVLSAGTEEGFYLGLLTALLVIGYKLKKEQLPVSAFTRELPFGVVATFFSYYLLHWEIGAITTLPWGVTVTDLSLRYHPVSIYQLLFCLLLFLLLYRARVRTTKPNFPLFLLLFSIGQIIISYTTFPHPYLFGLSLTQMFFLLTAGIGAWFGLSHTRSPSC